MEARPSRVGPLGSEMFLAQRRAFTPPFDPGDGPQGTKLYACLFLSLPLFSRGSGSLVLGGPWSVCTGVEPGPGMCQGKF